LLKLRAIGDTGGLERLLILSGATANPYHHRRRLKLRAAARRGLLKLRTASSRRLKRRRIGGLLELVARHLLLQECRAAAALTAGRRLEGLAAGRQLLVRNS
jgi:hypothetical protein